MRKFNNHSLFVLSMLFGFLMHGSVASAQQAKAIANPYYSRVDTTTLEVSNSVWKKILPADLYSVAREGATEQAFTGVYNDFDGKGTYYCAVCGNALFRSTAKFATTCGWPSFYEPMRDGSVFYEDDYSYNMHRIEVRCGRCDSHLGHVFDDGPAVTGKRYCMNSISLTFEADSPKNKFKK
ncbi:peptide-methionine (R)-S-oxide reductase MsrB [Sphingobacterium oryzagri]|uniref:peptide-methionine (R)-S-oxide reductase n=1 Tax=Sphingobacterium oryzagri TaxID=3025669 RepID=A0ABY7WNP0_9SPHI|nr:peptide-methionine (R)-S-oxide reductase MsrB [Sphingobacterium sp. KACC 22765]WDF70031.1 peptide-methionine (R)-S-oxide reductase MsrB [Sphingobacterium sp. KACC 22765]